MTEPLWRLPLDRTLRRDLRYYSAAGPLTLIRQYSEVQAEKAHELLEKLLTSCLRRWFGDELVPAEVTGTYTQDFWLRGPERGLRLWVRFTDPHFDVIAKLDEFLEQPTVTTLVVPYDDLLPS